MKTNLEIFNQVEKHLLKQKARSHSSLSSPAVEGTACAYRGYGGMKCAVGCLIKDEYFDPEFNTRTVMNVNVRDMLGKSGIYFDKNTLDMLISLQSVHDTTPIDQWPKRLKGLRTQYNRIGAFA